jgi:hypothetical protein
VTLAERFSEVCALWALEERGLTFRDPAAAMQFVLENWSELYEACEIADGVKGKVASEPIVAAMVDAMISAGEIRAMCGEGEEEVAKRFALMMLRQAGFTFPDGEAVTRSG